MDLEWDRPGVIRLTAGMEELGDLIAGARLAVERLGDEVGLAPFAGLVTAFDEAAPRLSASRPASGTRPEGGPASFYHEGSRLLQSEFGTTRLADRIEQVHVTPTLGANERSFIERSDSFFLATADAAGRPACSYKGGDPGFVRVLDEATIAFPVYDGNGMYLSAGNLAVNPNVGMLFVDLERGHRLRLSGRAAIVRDAALVGLWPEAQMAVRVEVREAFPNCPRYVHRYRLVERSRFVPHEGVETPVPEWKQEPWARDVVERDHGPGA